MSLKPGRSGVGALIRAALFTERRPFHLDTPGSPFASRALIRRFRSPQHDHSRESITFQTGKIFVVDKKQIALDA